LCVVTSSFATDFQVPLNYNWNGIAHPGEAGNADAPAGFRSIADRALYVDGATGNALGTSPIVGATGVTYSVNMTANVLDIVHLGNTGAGTTRTWDAAANGDARGIQPTWLPNPSAHTAPQITTLGTPLTLDSNSSIGVLYFVSNGGGNFDMVLGFTDASSVTVTLKANDWFGATNPPAAGPGVASQTRLGATTYTGTSNTDNPITQTWPTQALAVTEAVVTITSLSAIGFNATGKTLSTITFQNATQPTRGYAIFATTVVTGLGPPVNDNCSTPTVVTAGTTATDNNRATGSTTSPCGTADTTDVWYSYQATASGPVEVRTCGAQFDTTLAIYATCGGAAIACNDNGCGLASRLQFNATSGQNYLIRVAGNNGATGTFNLVIDNNPAVHTDQPITLNYNWNGMVHTGEDGQPDAPAGFRSISDRAFYSNAAAGAINGGQLVGTDFIPYAIVNQAGALDIVHLGLTGPGSPRQWDTVANGDAEGIQPTWLPTLDQSSPQRTNLASLNIGMGANTRVAVLYHVSNGGGLFDCVLEFGDGTTATLTLAAPDWFGDQTPPSALPGIEVQRELGTFSATQNQDLAALGAPSLNLIEAVFSTSSLIGAGASDPTGKRLTGIRFQNPSTLTASYAIFAATLRDAVPNFSPTSPSGVGAASPNPTEQTRSVLFTVSVSPGLNPTSTGLAVQADLSSFGGSSTQSFYDDGPGGGHGDAVAGDNVFSFRTTVSASQATGPYTLPFTVTDAQSRSATGSISVTVNSYAWNESLDGGGDAGDLPATAMTIPGAGPLTAIRGSGGGNDADMYAIYICDPTSFSASTSNTETNLDTQLFLFNSSGIGVASDDDNPAGGFTSVITNTFVTTPGLYYLAITTYDKDPLDSSGNLIWNDTPYNVERAPDGPGAANPIAQWNVGAGGSGGYLITLTGVCRGAPSRCGTADFNCDGAVGTDADIESFFACLSGNCPPPPCTNNADFNGDGATGTDADIEAFFRVLSGGPC
jgi:hypothetical protein